MSIKLVGNSWVAPNQGYGPFGWVHNVLSVAQRTPNGLPDFVDVAPYTLNYLGNFDTNGSNVAAHGCAVPGRMGGGCEHRFGHAPASNSQSMYLNQQYVQSQLRGWHPGL